MLGIRLKFDGMIIDPCIPLSSKEFQVVRKWRGATYNITVRSPEGVQKGITTVMLNGKPVPLPILQQEAGSTNEVFVTMG
jgi:N,N'-diacetylchitobiose phosphorylase